MSGILTHTQLENTCIMLCEVVETAIHNRLIQPIQLGSLPDQTLMRVKLFGPYKYAREVSILQITASGLYETRLYQWGSAHSSTRTRTFVVVGERTLDGPTLIPESQFTDIIIKYSLKADKLSKILADLQV